MFFTIHKNSLPVELLFAGGFNSWRNKSSVSCGAISQRQPPQAVVKMMDQPPVHTDESY